MSGYDDIIKKCKKDWDCPDLMDSVNKVNGRKIPFSSPSLNYATYGGVPRGAMIELYGIPGGGKSSTAIDLCKNAVMLFNHEYEEEIAALTDKVASGKKEYKIQLADLNERGPKKVLYIDLEHSFDKKWAATLGITNSAIEIMQPPDVAAERILQMVQELICTGEIGFLVLDSIPSLVTQNEIDKKYGERTVASLAGLMTGFCRKITQLLSRYDCTVVLINQLRANLDNPYVDNTPGGEAIKFYCSLRMSFRLGSPLDFLGNEIPQKSENPAGYLINVKLVKQKSAPFDRKLATYFLMAQSGLRTDFEFANLAIKRYDIIRKAGAWFTICDPHTKEPLEVDDSIVKVNGMAKVYDYLQTHPDYYQRLCEYIIDDINHNGMEVESIESE